MLDISKNIVWPSDIPEEIVLYPTSLKNTRLFQWSISFPISTKLHRKIGEKVKIRLNNFWWNFLTRTRRRPIKRGRRCFKNLFPHIVRHSRDSMRKQSSAIYIQMNFCGSYSFVCEYGNTWPPPPLRLSSKSVWQPWNFLQYKMCCNAWNPKKQRHVENKKKEGVPSVVAVVRPKIIRVVNLERGTSKIN